MYCGYHSACGFLVTRGRVLHPPPAYPPLGFSSRPIRGQSGGSLEEGYLIQKNDGGFWRYVNGNGTLTDMDCLKLYGAENLTLAEWIRIREGNGGAGISSASGNQKGITRDTCR